MKTNSLISLTIGLLVGIIGTTAVMRTKTTPAPRTASAAMDGAMSGMEMPSSGASMSMAEMTAGLKGLTGDEFDKKFLSEMIDHHQGAIDMASLARTQAKHDEVKALASNIIAAQTSEIAQMRDWQKRWGY